jgi:hypothetical protein
VAIDEAAFLRLDDGPVAELDLGEQAAGERSRPVRGPRRRFARRVVMGPSLPPRQEFVRRWQRWWPVVVAALAGALLGGALVHVADRSGERGEAALFVALGESGGRVISRRSDDRPVLVLAAVAVNRSGSTLTLRGVRVEGSGASTVRTWRGEPAIYPLTIEPGQTRDLPLAVVPDCAVRGAEPPRVLVDLTFEDGTSDTVEVTIPGLPALWQQALTDEDCVTA